MNRLKKSQIPAFKKELLKQQGGKCGICSIDLSEVPARDLCLDHCHTGGHIRSVLCRNCNGIEGKIKNLANRGKRKRTTQGFLRSVLEYWEQFDGKIGPNTVFHPDHKTEDEKRLERNRKARLRRAKNKATQNVNKGG